MTIYPQTDIENPKPIKNNFSSSLATQLKHDNYKQNREVRVFYSAYIHVQFYLMAKVKLLSHSPLLRSCGDKIKKTLMRYLIYIPMEKNVCLFNCYLIDVSIFLNNLENSIKNYK